MSSVVWERDRRGVMTVTLNRPEVHNAYDGELIQNLLRALDEAAAHPPRIVVVRGAGRHFQAGADLRWIQEVSRGTPEESEHASRTNAEAMYRLNHLPVPTVALVQGGCFGGGTGIVAGCDVVVAADNAFFSISETRWGLIASIIVPQLNDAMGVRNVRRYALTGERFDAQEALRIGLVHEVVPAAELEAAGARVVDALLQTAPEASSQTKAVALEFAWGTVPAETRDRLAAQHAAKRRSAEAVEGLRSFQEKRPAAWYVPE